MKKTAALIALAALSIGSALPASATYEGGSGDSRPVKALTTFRLTADAENGKVYLRWSADPANDWKDGWLYWKVVRSTDNASPTYPEDGYIKYESDRTGFSSYVDESPETVPAWYRVCAITERVRYCSNVVKVAGQTKAQEVPAPAAQPAQPALAPALKAKVDAIAVSLRKGLDAKFGSDDAKKAAWIDARLAAVSALREKAPALVDYLLSRLTYLRDAYKNSSLPSEIENLLKVE